MSLGYGDDGFGVGDSPRPGERAEDRSASETFWTHGHKPVRTAADESEARRLAAWVCARQALQGVRRLAVWAVLARARQEGFSDGK